MFSVLGGIQHGTYWRRKSATYGTTRGIPGDTTAVDFVRSTSFPNRPSSLAAAHLRTWKSQRLKGPRTDLVRRQSEIHLRRPDIPEYHHGQIPISPVPLWRGRVGPRNQIGCATRPWSLLAMPRADFIINNSFPLSSGQGPNDPLVPAFVKRCTYTREIRGGHLLRHLKSVTLGDRPTTHSFPCSRIFSILPSHKHVRSRILHLRAATRLWLRPGKPYCSALEII